MKEALVPFMVICPECDGRRRYYRPKEIEMPVPSDDPMEFGTLVYERELIACVKCNGVGEVEQTKRIAVMQDGARVGTVPPTFDPQKIKSMSPLYDPRPDDFVRAGDTWRAHPMLGDGDLEAVPGFVWDRQV